MVAYGCAFSGISAASVAWSALGWRCRWFAEIDAFACAVLRHHYPSIPNLGDVTRISEAEPIDVLVAGSPCQSFSVQGERGGITDPRGNLALEVIRLARLARARWVVWENVTGVFSSGGRRNFGRIVAEYLRAGYGVAWRVLDARHFGLPQRRRRLFLIGHSCGCFRGPAAVLADRAAESPPPGAADEVRSLEAYSAGSAGSAVYGWTGDETPKIISNCCPTIRAYQGGEGTGIITEGRARKFLPVELERLQGLPDGYTAITCKGKPATDKQRIRVLGNTFPAPMIRWIGEGIAAIEGIGDLLGQAIA